MILFRHFTCLLLLILLFTPELSAQKYKYELEEAFPLLTTSFPEMTDVLSPQDGSDRLFVSTRQGEIYVFENRTDITEASLVLDLSTVITTEFFETGLLGFDLHPDFAENGYVYVYYMVRRGSYFYTLISRFTYDPASGGPIDLSTEVKLFDFRQPAVHHNGGQVRFGPDGYLYIALGDGIDPHDPLNSGQDLRSMLGKILRVDVDTPTNGKNYGIPDTNPFAGNSEYAQEIYAWGLRNPWRFSFDPPTGRIWAGDVGQFQWEEINLIQKGGNYGWRIMEGYHCHLPENDCDSIGLIGPIWEYPHTVDVESSITGGYVYRGPGNPQLEGLYIYSDFASGRIWALDYKEDSSVNTLLMDSDIRVAAFGIDEKNELYIGNYLDGKLYKFTSTLVGVSDPESVMTAFLPIIPNPATSRSTISWKISRRAPVSLSLFSIRGEETIRLIDQTQEAGEHHIDIDVEQLPAGTYYVQLTAGENQITRPLTIVH